MDASSDRSNIRRWIPRAPLREELGELDRLRPGAGWRPASCYRHRDPGPRPCGGIRPGLHGHRPPGSGLRTPPDPARHRRRPGPWIGGSARGGIRHGPLPVTARGTAVRASRRKLRPWMAAPIVTRQPPLGAVAARRMLTKLHRTDLARLEAYCAMAALALASAVIVDQADETRRSWAETLDAIGLPLCIVERSGRVRRANRAFLELVQSDAGAGVLWLALVPPAWGAGIQASLDAAGRAWKPTCRRATAPMRCPPFPWGPTCPAAAFALIFHDRTERRRLQAQLVQSEKMSAVGQLVAGRGPRPQQSPRVGARLRRFPGGIARTFRRACGSRSGSSSRSRCAPRTSYGTS